MDHAQRDFHLQKPLSPKDSRSPVVTTLILVGLSISFAIFLFVIFSIKNLVITTSDPTTAVIKSNQKTPEASNDSIRKRDLQSLETALKNYYGRYQVYPNNLSGLLPSFLSILPTDPETGQVYSYQAQLDQKGFILTAYLSRGSYTITGN